MVHRMPQATLLSAVKREQKKNYNRAVSYYTTTGRKHGCPAFPSGSINYRVVYADGRALPLEKKTREEMEGRR